MQEYRERLRHIHYRDYIVNNDRICLDHTRWLCTESSIANIRRYLSHGELDRAKKESDSTISMMADAVRSQRPRSLSMNALYELPRDTRMAPSTTWKVSYNQDDTRDASAATVPKSSIRRRLRERLDQYEQDSYLNRAGSKKLVDARTAETETEEDEAGCIGMIKRVRFREGCLWEERESEGEGHGESNRHTIPLEMKKKCFVVWSIVRWIICLPPLPQKPAIRHGKAKVVKGILKTPHTSEDRIAES